MQGGGSYENVEITYFLVERPLTLSQRTANLGVLNKHIADAEHCDKAPQPLWLFDMSFVVATIVCAECQLSQCHLRYKELRSG